MHPNPSYPAWQAHADAQASDIDRGGHSTHAVAPVTLAYLPATQQTHSDAPDTLLYVPAAQGIHTSGAAEPTTVVLASLTKPAWHRHALLSVLPTGEEEFGMQESHAVAPEAF